jgi:very-short-patch-repair endonuclease
MRGQGRTLTEVIAETAGRQHGNVTRGQLLRAGVSARQIDRRLISGALIPIHRGVYRVGHRGPSAHATYMAAVLACGDGALLSGLAAAHLLGLTKRPPSMPEVTTKTERRIEGIRTVRTRRERHRTIWFGIPVTSPAETVIDLAPTLDDHNLARAVHEAQIKHGLTPAQVEAALRRPSAKLAAILTGETRVSLSALERRFKELLSEDDLPLPVTNVRVDSHYVDCRWPEHRLTVELDSYRFHNTRHAWEQDRRREREARARGDDFRRFSYDDVFERPAQTVREMRTALRTGSALMNAGPPALLASTRQATTWPASERRSV